MKKALWVLILYVSSHQIIKAQAFQRYRIEAQNYFSLGVGSTSYFGDLQNQSVNPNLALNAELVHRISPGIKITESLTFLRLTADDSRQRERDLRERNLSFQSWNLELSMRVHIQLFKTWTHWLRPESNVYLFAGLGGVSVNPTTKLNGKKYHLRRLATEGRKYAGVALVWPMGLGIEVSLNREFSFVFETGYHFTSTDYLDDVSTKYYLPEDKSETFKALADRTPELGLPSKRTNMVRGNPRNRDGYIISIIKLRYMLHHMNAF